MINGGYVLKPRIIKDSDISNASPCVRETWDYLIREANHKGYKRGNFEIKRGQLFRSYSEILDDLCWYVGWRKETYSEGQMKKAMKFLRDTQRITTQKKPGGVLITVCKYDTYQDPSNYERTYEGTTKSTVDEPSTNHRRTSHNYKNDNNDNNEKNESNSAREKIKNILNGFGKPIFAKELFEIDGFTESFTDYWVARSKHWNHNPNEITVKEGYRRLLELKKNGNDVLEVIRQSARNSQKEFYPLRDNKYQEEDEPEPIYFKRLN